MTRSEMVNNYNFWVRKRDSYIEKIATNSSIRGTLSASLSNCETYSADLGNYSDAAVLFENLHQKTNASFNANVTSDILEIIDDVGTHLEGVKTNAQQQINYYDGLIREYDEANKDK